MFETIYEYVDIIHDFAISLNPTTEKTFFAMFCEFGKRLYSFLLEQSKNVYRIRSPTAHWHIFNSRNRRKAVSRK